MKIKKVALLKSIFWMGIVVLITGYVVLFYIQKSKIGFLETLKKKIKLVQVDQIVRYFSFSTENCLQEWEEKILKGKVIYVVEKNQDLSYVRATSDKTASALYYKIKLNIDKKPVISWKWRVNTFPTRRLPERIEDKREEDFAARVYVIFPAAFFTKSKVIEYIWSETLAKGTTGTSGYSPNIKIMVLQKGKAEEWRLEKRLIYDDYVALFGEKPELNVGAIAFMTDADSTKTSADAIYDEIEIGYE